MKAGACFALFVVLLAVGHGFKNKSAAHLLYKHLIVDQDYNKNVRPAVNASQATAVELDLYLITIVDFNEVSEQLSITAKLEISWTDEYLTWDPALFGGREWTHFPQGVAWKPDIALENSVTKYQDLGSESMYILVKYTGQVLWKPLEVFQSTCTADVTKYPMDVQTCCLSFEAWSHDQGNLEIFNKSDHVYLHHGYDGQPQWRIESTQAKRMIFGGDQYVNFCLTLKRQSNYVMLNIILPIALLSLLNSCVFLLPAACGEKASFSVTVFLSLSVFLTIISEQLPKTSNKVSMFNLYVFIQVLISTLITMTTLAQIRLFHRDNSRLVPKWLQGSVNSCKLRKRGSTQNCHNVNSDANADSENLPKSESFVEKEDSLENVTWAQVAEWMDPAMFMIYTSLNILFSLSIVTWSLTL